MYQLIKINSKTREGTSKMFEYIYSISVRVLDLKRLELKYGVVLIIF